jgi:hypothetical protein
MDSELRWVPRPGRGDRGCAEPWPRRAVSVAAPSRAVAVTGSRSMHQLVAFFRRNPQVFVLLVICLVLGIATFIAAVVGLISSGSTKITGEPSGVILAALRLAVGVR